MGQIMQKLDHIILQTSDVLNKLSFFHNDHEALFFVMYADHSLDAYKENLFHLLFDYFSPIFPVFLFSFFFLSMYCIHRFV